MQRLMISKTLLNPILRPTIRFKPPTQKPCHVFINHRGIDTKRNMAALLYQHLSGLGFNPFLDRENLKPGDNLLDKIDREIKNCPVGVAVFSPRYCESYFCLHELALMMECKKKVVPIFCDVKPSELKIKDDGSCSHEELERFNWALEEAKSTVGLNFDTTNGEWSEFLSSATDAILQSLLEAQENQEYLNKQSWYYKIY